MNPLSAYLLPGQEQLLSYHGIPAGVGGWDKPMHGGREGERPVKSTGDGMRGAGKAARGVLPQSWR